MRLHRFSPLVILGLTLLTATLITAFVQYLDFFDLFAGGNLVLVAYLSIKYLIYDILGAICARLIKGFAYRPWHNLGYGIVVVLDLLLVYSAGSGRTSDEFAFVGMIFGTPWVLLVAFIVTCVATIKHRRAS